ncbi:MAG: hypothetical protein HY898_08385 [Deltaproteobacteria bacterium]|nr:hypothetical protein [Deltaproteobacteria bacterium]
MNATTTKRHAWIIAAACSALGVLGSGWASAQGPSQAPAQPSSQPPSSASAHPALPPSASAAASSYAATIATARPTATAQADTPSVHHAPVSTARAHEPLNIKASIDRTNQLRAATVVYQIADGSWHEAPFQRASEGPYLAILPADVMIGPSIAYTIEIEDTQGRRFAVFASREAPHRVQVPDDIADLRERALATRLDNRRSVASASGEYVYFGSTTTQVTTPTNSVLHSEKVPDQYYRVEGSYTYRPLGTIAEFSIRIGVVRGTSIVPGTTDRDKYDVGLNYGSPSVRFRLDDAWHLETSLVTSVTELGFSAGAGGALLVGDPYGTKFTVGFETIQTFGSRFYSRLDILANRTLLISPIIEVTDMPHADRYGLRLLGEMRFDLGSGFGVGLRGGYQARLSTGGGPTLGGILAYAF